MKRTLVMLIALVTIAGLSSACSSDDDASSTSNESESTTVKPLTFSDAATPIAVVPGEPFSISLESNPSTGYQWTITEQPDPELVTVENESGTVNPGDNDSGAVGVPGTTTFDFKAKASGTATVTFTYARSFDPEDSPTSTTFTINVS